MIDRKEPPAWMKPETRTWADIFGDSQTIPEIKTWEKPKQWWEQTAEPKIGKAISSIPLLPKTLEKISPAFEWVHEKLEKSWSAFITSPWSPQLPWESGESWLEHEKREYEAWKAPTYIKGAAEFSMPLWWLPWVGWAGKGARAVIGAGRAAKLAKILPKLPEEALLPTYDTLAEHVPNNILKKAVLWAEHKPIIGRMVKVVGGEAAFTRRNPITAADKAKNYAVFYGIQRDMGENIVRTQLPDLYVKSIIKGKAIRENELLKLFDTELLEGQIVNGKVGVVTTDATHKGVQVVGKPKEIPSVTPEVTVKSSYSALHKDIPIKADELESVVSDIRTLYPEADSVSVVGTYARVTETPIPRRHDIDITIHFPKGTDKEIIRKIPDDFLWHKWGSRTKNVDFLFHFGDEIPAYGQHLLRLEEGLPIPRVKIWSLAIPKAEAGKTSYLLDDVIQNPNAYAWLDDAGKVLKNPMDSPAFRYVKQAHETVKWFTDWATASGVKLPATKKGLQVVGEIIQEHMPRIAKGKVTEEGIGLFKKTDPFREMIYETALEGAERGVKYGGSLADRVELMARAITNKVARVKFNEAIRPLGETVLERLEKRFPTVIADYSARANKLDILNKTLLALQKSRAVHPETLSKLEYEFPALAQMVKETSRLKTQDIVNYVRKMSKSSQLIIERNKKPLIESLLAQPQNNTFYDTIAIVSHFAKNEEKAIRLVERFYSLQVKAQAGLYRDLINNAKKVLKSETDEFASVKNQVLTLKRQLRTPKVEQQEAVFKAIAGLGGGKQGARIFPQEVVDVIQPLLLDRGQDWARALSGVSGTSRMLVAALDLSAPFIQGLAVFGSNPIVWGKSVLKMLQIAAKPERLWLELAARKATRLDRVLSGGSTSMIDFFEAMPLLRRGARRVAGGIGEKAVAQTYGRAEAAFLGFGEIARDEMWKAQSWLIGAKGLSEAEKVAQLQDLARNLDRMTGVMSPTALGIGLTQQQIESAWVFFAPRYTRAGLSFAGDILRGGFTGAEARKAFAGMVLGGLTMYKAITEATGQQMNLDPRSARFMTIEVGGRHVGVGGIYYAMLRTLADVVATAQEEPKMLSPLNLSRVDNPFYKFMYARSSPLTGLVTGLAIEHKNYFGEPFESSQDYATFMLDKVIPIAAQSVMPWHKKDWDENVFEPAVFAAEIGGLRTFPTSTWEVQDVARDNLSLKTYNKRWTELTRAEQREIEADNPILEKLADEIKTTQVQRGKPLDIKFNNWLDELDAIREQRDDGVQIASQMYDLDKDGYAFRQRISDIDNDYSAILNHISKNPQYKDVYGTLANPLTQAERLSKMQRLDAAYQVWMQYRYSKTATPWGRMQNELGEPNWANVEKFKDWFGTQFGEDALRYAEEERPMAGRDVSPIYLELRKAREILRPYWQIRDDIIEVFGENYAESSWGQRLLTKKRQELLLSNPEMRKYYDIFYKKPER